MAQRGGLRHAGPAFEGGRRWVACRDLKRSRRQPETRERALRHPCDGTPPILEERRRTAPPTPRTHDRRFQYQSLLPLGEDDDAVSPDHERPREGRNGARSRVLCACSPKPCGCSPAKPCATSRTCCGRVTSRSCARILDDPEASDNDRFVALDLLKNANIAAGGVLPMCQDTGTAIVMGKRGQYVLTDGHDEAAIARGVYDTYLTSNLRYSQLAPLDMYREVNTKTNLPAQIEIYAYAGSEYHFLFMAKGGGSANKSYLYQETKALLNPESLMAFLDAKLRSLGTAACPPYHLARSRRRHLGRIRAQDRQARLRALPRLAAHDRQRARAWVSRRRARAAGVRARADDEHRRAVRRQVLLPRRARDPPAAARRVVPGGDRRLLLGRPSGARQDHEGRRVPRAARGGSGALLARGLGASTSPSRS